MAFMDNGFSVCRVNFRGVGKSDGEFDNSQGRLADATATLDGLKRKLLIIHNVGLLVFLLDHNFNAIINEKTRNK